jgi:hypothetical protein
MLMDEALLRADTTQNTTHTGEETMMPSPLDQVQQFIKQGKAHEARQILTKLLYKDSTDPQLWWLFAQVPENKNQLYAILDSLVEMPTNPYTGRARAMLSRLPYRPSEEVRKNLPVKNLAVQQHKSPTRIFVVLGVALTVVVVLVIVAVLVLRNPGTSVTTAARPADTQVLAAQNQVTVNQVAAAASKTPLPSVTPGSMPTSAPTAQSTLQPTKMRQATVIPPTLTATAATPDLAAVLPDLNRAFVSRTTTLLKLVDEATGLLEGDNGLSPKVLGAIADKQNQIRKLRNEMILMNGGTVPTEVRVKIITPAHTAFTNYADSALQWIDTQIQARQLPSTASASDGMSSNESSQNQTTKATQQTTGIKADRKALETALNRYNMFTAEVVLRAQSSDQTRVVSSDSPQPLKVTSGKYKINYQVAFGSDPAKIALWLVPEDGTATKLALLDPKKLATSGAIVIEVKESRYQIQAEGVSWWVVGIEPQ